MRHRVLIFSFTVEGIAWHEILYALKYRMRVYCSFGLLPLCELRKVIISIVAQYAKTVVSLRTRQLLRHRLLQRKDQAHMVINVRLPVELNTRVTTRLWRAEDKFQYSNLFKLLRCCTLPRSPVGPNRAREGSNENSRC